MRNSENERKLKELREKLKKKTKENRAAQTPLREVPLPAVKLESKPAEAKLLTVGTVAGALLLSMAVILRLYCASAGKEAPFFMWFEAGLCALGLALLIAEAVRASRVMREERLLSEREQSALFADAERISVCDTEKMLEESLGTASAVPEAQTFAETDVSFKEIVSGFEAFAKKFGVRIRKDAVRRLIAALASSRLLVICGMDERDFKALIRLLSEYFGMYAGVDSVPVAELEKRGDGAFLFVRNGEPDEEDADFEMTYLLQLSSRMRSEDIGLIGWGDVNGVIAERICNCFADCWHHPFSEENAVFFAGGLRNAKPSVIPIPIRCRFALQLADGVSPADLPAELVRAAAVLEMPVKLRGWVSADHRLVEQTPMPLTHPSLEKLTNKALESHFPEEALWKRIDLLEQSAGLSESGVYGNLRRRAAERFVCAYGACGGTASEAVDEAAAALLIAPMAIRRRSNDEDAAQSAERILGEGCADACVRTAALYRRHT